MVLGSSRRAPLARVEFNAEKSHSGRASAPKPPAGFKKKRDRNKSVYQRCWRTPNPTQLTRREMFATMRQHARLLVTHQVHR